MALLDALKQVLGLKAEADAGRDADPEDLFGMSTAYVTMEADLGYVPLREAALCFGDVDSTAFNRALEETREILDLADAETGTVAAIETDDYGYRWVVVAADDFEDLVSSLHYAADTLIEHGFGSRLLAAVFGFDPDPALGADPDRTDPVYWIYSFRRGSYYPFAPAGGEDRDERIEFTLQSVFDGELDVEDDRSYWYPLWPDHPGAHPWE